MKKLCKVEKHEEDIQVFKLPSLALHIGHHMRKLAGMLCGLAVREDNKTLQEGCEKFLKLMEWEWADRISTVAVATLKANWHNRPKLLPLTEDLTLLKKFLAETVVKQSEALKVKVTKTDWRLLCEAAVVWTLLLNKHRSNEVALIKTSSFVDRPKWSETANQDIVSTFNDSEKGTSRGKHFTLYLISYNVMNNIACVIYIYIYVHKDMTLSIFFRIDLIESMGKINKKVTTIFLPEMISAIDLLLATRNEAGISPSNEYLFPNYVEGHLNGWQTMNCLAV